MPLLKCRDFGHNCDYEVQADNISELLEKFGNHSSLEHGIKHSPESLKQFIVGDTISCPYCSSKFETKEILSKHIDRIHHGSGVLEGDTRGL